MSTVLPLKEQAELLEVSWPNSSKSPEKEVTLPTPISPQLRPEVPTPDHDVLEKNQSLRVC